MNIRRWMILLGLLGVAFLVLTTLGDPHKIISAFERVQWYVVPLVIICQLVDYYTNAKYYEVFFNISSHKVSLKRLYEASLGINFANQAIPSGGIAGTTYLAEALEEYDIPAGKTTLAQVGRYIFTFLTYFIVLAFGFLMLFFSGDLDKVSVRFVVFIMVIILTGGTLVITLLATRSRMETVLGPVVRFINRFGRTVLRREKPVIHAVKLDNFLTEFYNGYGELVRHKRQWPALLGWSLGGNLAEVITIYVVFIAFGQWVNPGVVITGYTLAIIASIGGLLVNGLGVYEAGMIGTFAALGVPFALAFAVVIVYRVLNMGIFLPIGLVFYRKHLQETT